MGVLNADLIAHDGLEPMIGAAELAVLPGSAGPAHPHLRCGGVSAGVAPAQSSPMWGGELGRETSSGQRCHMGGVTLAGSPHSILCRRTPPSGGGHPCSAPAVAARRALHRAGRARTFLPTYTFYMESERRDLVPEAADVRLSPDQAADHLRRHDEVLERAQRRRAPRAETYVMFWGGLFGAVTMTAVLFAIQRVHSSGQDFPVMLLVPPLLALQQLIDGLRERWGTRRRTSLLEWVFLVPAVIGFVVVAWFSVDGTAYPWWLIVGIGLVFFVGAGLIPLVQTWHGGASVEPEPGQRTRRPLSGPVKVTTVAIGVIGALCIVSSTEEWFMAPALAAILLIAASGLGRGSRWSLCHAGYEWRPFQWSAFGLVAFVTIGAPLLLTLTNSFAGTGLWFAGGVVAAVMAIAALWPAPTR